MEPEITEARALIVENADGSTACDLRYRSHHIFNGKYKIPGLPAVYADETESQTLEIVMEECGYRRRSYIAVWCAS